MAVLVTVDGIVATIGGGLIELSVTRAAHQAPQNDPTVHSPIITDSVCSKRRKCALRRWQPYKQGRAPIASISFHPATLTDASVIRAATIGSFVQAVVRVVIAAPPLAWVER